MSVPVLSVRGLRVVFPTRRGTLIAVDDVSFEIAAGEVLGVVGESGAGKSLTGAAVIGLLEPPGRAAGGEVRLKGERIDNLPPEAMRRVRGPFTPDIACAAFMIRLMSTCCNWTRSHCTVGDGDARSAHTSTR